MNPFVTAIALRETASAAGLQSRTVCSAWFLAEIKQSIRPRAIIAQRALRQACSTHIRDQETPMKQTNPLIRTVGAACVIMLMAASTASAHVGLTPHAHGFSEGVLHPLSGLDHMAAMFAVGLWSATLGGTAVLSMPAAFVALLCTGALFGVGGLLLPGVEPIITASVVALGFLVAANVKMPVPLAALIVAAFGLFHGNAHGVEMPAAADPLGYGLGFVLSTVFLHVAGISVGVISGRATWCFVRRWLGAGLAASGVMMAVLG